MALDDEDMTTTGGSGAEGPADSGAGSGTPGEHDGGADGGERRAPPTPEPAAAPRASTTVAPTAAQPRARPTPARAGVRPAHTTVGPTGARTAVPADPAVADAASPVTGRPRGGPPGPGPLARCVGDPDVFAAQYWGRAPLLTRNATGGFRDLLDLDGVDELLSRRGLRTRSSAWRRRARCSTRRRSPRPAGSAPRSATRSATTRWRPCSPTAPPSSCRPCTAPGPPVIDFCTRLAAELGHPVQANSYVTPPSSRGFSAHYDVHDVFVLQLAGRKHWTIHAPVLARPAARPAVGAAVRRGRRRGAGAAGDRHGPGAR